MPGYTATVQTRTGGATIGWFVGYTPVGKHAVSVVLEDANGTDAARASGALEK
jgi:beta-lactamase class D